MSTIKSSADHLTINADGASKDIKFQANGVQKASISSAGAFTSTTIDATVLTGALPAISGAALTGVGATGMDDVSGVARATSGLLFNGDTAAANVLDDYEEGTWTPTVSITTTGSPAYAGTYTKIGNIVTAFFYSTTSGSAASYSVSSGNYFRLPFSSANFNGSIQTQSGTAINGDTSAAGTVGTDNNNICYFFTSIAASSGISATITYHI
jgi:hypothetical protein